jgi:hypothetical protein
VPRKVGDFVAASLALAVLFVMLISISPQLRERTQQVVSNPQGSALRGTVTHAFVSGMAVVHGYAGDNTYMVTFLVAACVFTVLMLKVIS